MRKQYSFTETIYQAPGMKIYEDGIEFAISQLDHDMTNIYGENPVGSGSKTVTDARSDIMNLFAVLVG